MSTGRMPALTAAGIRQVRADMAAGLHYADACWCAGEHDGGEAVTAAPWERDGEGEAA